MVAPYLDAYTSPTTTRIWAVQNNGGTLGGTPSGWDAPSFDDSAWAFARDVSLDDYFFGTDYTDNIGAPVAPSKYVAPTEAVTVEFWCRNLIWLARMEFYLPSLPSVADLILGSDDSAVVKINQTAPTSLGGSAISVAPFVVGWNVLTATISNGDSPVGWTYGNPTMLIARLFTDVVATAGPAFEWDAHEIIPPGTSINFVGTLADAYDRSIRPVRNGPGSGQFTINRYSPNATAAILKSGNLVKVRIPEIGAGYIFAFFMEPQLDTLVSSNEQGGEDIKVGGRGALSYWDRAVWLSENFVVPWWPATMATPPAGTRGAIIVQGGSGAAADIVTTKTAHGFVVNQRVKFTSLTGGSGLVAGTTYFVIAANLTANTFQLAATAGGAAIDFTTDITAGVVSAGGSNSTIISSPSTLDIINTSASHGFVVDQKVRFTALTGGAGLVLDTDYYVVAGSLGATTFKVSATVGGTPVNYTTDITAGTVAHGGGSHIVRARASYIRYQVVNGVIVGSDTFSTTSGFSAYFDTRKTYAWPAANSKRFLVHLTTTEDPASPDRTDYYFHPHQAGVTEYLPSYVLGSSIPLSSISADKPGAVLYWLFNEGQAASRPVKPIPLMTIDFTATLDSAGNPWSTTDALASLTANLGETYLETIAKLVSTGVIDVEMGPNLDMHAYNSQGVNRSSATFAADKVRFVKGVNIADNLDRERNAGPVATWIEVIGTESVVGQAALADAASRVARETSGLGDSNVAAALSAKGLADLNAQLVKSDAVGFAIRTGNDDATGLYLPGPATSANGDFWLGDTVRVHTGTGAQDFNEQNLRVAAVTISEDAAGNLLAFAEVGSELGASDPLGAVSSTPALAGGTAARSPHTETEVAEPPPDFDVLIDPHLTNATDAHDASAVSFVPAAGIGATNVQAAIEEDAGDLAAHAGAADPHTGYQKESEVGVWYAKAYGATGNGTTNDAAAIQAAMDACGAAGGGIVYVAGGDYKLGTTSLKFRYSNIRVIGSGKHISATSIATRLTYTGGGAMFENSDTATPTVRNYCGVQSMTLDFSGATTGASALKINAFRSGMWSELYIVSNSTGAGGTWRGIWMTGGTNNQTYFNRFTDVDIALTGAAGTQWCVDMDGFWVNRNTFFGGIWEGNNANALGIRPASSFSDTNHFEAVQFQTHGATIVQLGGSGGQANDNSFVACRFESTVATVITFATASGIPQRNTFINSYRSNVNFSDPDMGAGNQIVDSYGWLLDTLKPGDAPNSILLRGYQSGMTIGRSDGASGVLSLGESNYGTAPAANFAQILSQDIGGVTKLRARFSDGSEWDIGPLHKVFRLAADHAISATTATEVTGLGPCTLVPGTYVFDFEIIEQSATATVSPLYGVNFTGTAAVKTIWFDYADASADLLAATNTADDEGTTALGFAMRQATRAYSTTAPNLGHAGGVATINVDIMVRVHGIVIVTASGDLELWHGSETATSTTVKAGSALIVTRVA